MSGPAFNDYLLPVLRQTADGAEHTIAELAEAIGKHFKLSDAELGEILPSGTQARHQHRVYRARTYAAPRSTSNRHKLAQHLHASLRCS